MSPLTRSRPPQARELEGWRTTGSDGTPVSAVRLTRAAVNRRPTQIVVVVTTHEPKRTIRFDHVGFINPSTEQTDELMRHDAADRCFCKLRAALSAIGDAARYRFKVGALAGGKCQRASEEQKRCY